jgi:hypothetical protein
VIVPVTLATQERKFYDEVVKQVWIDLQNDANDGDDVLAAALETASLSLSRFRTARRAWCAPAGAGAPVEHRRRRGRRITSSKMDACQEIILDNKAGAARRVLKFKNSVRTSLRSACATRASRSASTPETLPGRPHEPGGPVPAGELDVMVGTLDAMREGITLTALHLPLPDAPGCLAGTSRRGPPAPQRPEDAVTIYIYEANTVDDGKVRPANRLKEAIVSTVLVKDEIKEARHS